MCRRILIFYTFVETPFSSSSQERLIISCSSIKTIFSYRERHTLTRRLFEVGFILTRSIRKNSRIPSWTLLRSLGTSSIQFQNETTSHAVTEVCEQNTSFCPRIIFSAFNLYYIILSSRIIVLCLPMLLLFLPNAIHSKTRIFTKLRTALWTRVNNILETIHDKWNPHTTVAPE